LGIRQDLGRVAMRELEELMENAWLGILDGGR